MRSSALRSVGVNAAARLLVLPVSAVLGLVVTRLVLEQYGEADYAQYVLLVGIAALLPFADLGISAALMNAIAAAEDPHDDLHLRLVLVSSLRVLTCSAGVIVVLAAGLTALGVWDDLLGEGLQPDTGPVAAGLSLAVIGVTLLVSFGQRVLAGLNRYHVVILLNGLQTPIVLGVLLVMLATGRGSAAYLSVVALAATFLLSAVTVVLADRAVRPTLRLAIGEAFRLRTVRGAPVLATALPMLIQMVALPIAMQSDRLVLSHVADVDALTEYSLAAQMFTPFVGVVAMAGMALWPVFAQARARGERSEVRPGAMAVVFATVALGLGLVLSLASGWLAELASGGRITLGTGLVLAFTVFLVVQAAKVPLGMYMTDARGLRYQAIMVVLMLPVNLGLSVLLAQRYGAAGPVIGSIVGVLLFQVLANAVYVHRDLASGRSWRPAQPSG